MSNQARESVKELWPDFYAAVSIFPDFQVLPGLSAENVAELEKRLDFTFSPELREFFGRCAGLSMNGLSLKAGELGPIVMPGSDALVVGEFYLHNPGDRLLMLPEDPAIYYLEQRNGAITRLAGSLHDFFNNILPRYLA